MHRYRLTLEYDGSPFSGWQRQENGPSVQQAVEEAIARFCGEAACVHAAGRTDAGVHALAQVAHVDLTREVPAATVRDAVNFHLRPRPVAIVEAARVADDFHARFDATERRYRYRILNRHAPAVLDRGRVWRVPVPLDHAAMAAAAEVLLGRHDFTSFRSSMCQALSAEKTLDAVDVSVVGAEIRIDVRARSFLHNQVRIIVGTLKLVGDGSWTSSDVAAALAARDRAAAGPTAPPDGLYLVGVSYEPRRAR